MCGILGIASTARLTISDGEVCRLRDMLTHRGPDDAGLWRCQGVVLGHRRLAVLDPTPAGRQPMVTPDGRFVLVYNGEIYNESQLRRELEREGVRPASCGDTETLLHWLATRGRDGLRDLRGMFALALLDTVERRMLLARDPLGIKPLYWWLGRHYGAPLLLFASEPLPILAHPAVSIEPDLAVVSAYLTTIRTVVGDRTLFAGVRALPPGRVLTCDLDAAEIRLESRDLGIAHRSVPDDPGERVVQVRRALQESVEAHLRADVPTCCLLSGGLDSTIVTAVAARRHPDLRTYCAGVRTADESDDFAHARMAAAALGTRHAEAEVSESLFLERWPQMVMRSGTPLSTPNEVAINEVARRLAADGNVVTLSGEGADEVFGGYDQALRLAADHVAAGNRDPWLFQLEANAWCPTTAKADILTESVWTAVGTDEWLRAAFRAEFSLVARGDDPLADHMRFQRRVNLAGLLQRLDSATMLESVEGRTPFADGVVAALGESLPMTDRFMPPHRTKIVLRRAFADDLPGPVLARPKASFPLPFERWVRGAGQWIAGSAWLREIVRPEALALVAARPEACWRLAWPLANLALWSQRWWPAQNPAYEIAAEIGLGAPSPTLSTQ